jgi:hypothetical protein
MPSDIFDVTDPIIDDNDILRYEYCGYEPEAGTNLNTTGETRMHVTSKDTIFHPEGSYLLIEGRLKKANGIAYAKGDKATFVDNGIMFLFDSIRRLLSEKTTEEMKRPSQATIMLGLLKYARGFTKAQGLNQLWCKDTVGDLTAENQGYNIGQNYIIQKLAAKGSFSVTIPLSHINGFEEDYDKVVYGFKHTLQTLGVGGVGTT